MIYRNSAKNIIGAAGVYSPWYCKHRAFWVRLEKGDESNFPNRHIRIERCKDYYPDGLEGEWVDPDYESWCKFFILDDSPSRSIDLGSFRKLKDAVAAVLESNVLLTGGDFYKHIEKHRDLPNMWG